MSDDEEIDLREVYNSIKKHVKIFFDWKYTYEVLLLPIIYITWWIRTRNLGVLSEKYLIGLDPYYYYRLAKEVLATGSLPAFDAMRTFPFGGRVGFNFFPYFLAYWNKFLNLFGDFSLLYSGILYNPAITAFSIVFFYLFMKNVFDKKTALLASLILVVSPAYLFRTIAGFADHEALFMFLLFLSLWLFTEIKIRKKAVSKFFFASISGVITFFAATTWTAVPILTVPIGVFILMEILWANKYKKYFAAYSIWLASYLIPLLITRGAGAIRDISALVPLFALISLGVYLLLSTRNLKLRMPVGLVAILSTGAVGLLVALVFKIVNFSGLWAVILSPAEATGRVADTISEIIGGTAIFRMFGWLLLLAIAGAVFAAYNSFEDEHKKVKLFLAGVTLLVTSLTLLTNQTIFFNFILFAGFIVSLLVAYLVHPTFKPSNKPLVILPFIMFMFITYLTTTASRFLFIFAPVVAIFAAYFIFELIDNKPLKKYRLLIQITLISLSAFVLFKIFGGAIPRAIIVFIYGLLLTFTVIERIKAPYKVIVSLTLGFLMIGLLFSNYQDTTTQAKHIGSGLPGQWDDAFTWIRENTPEGSGVAHWWDYGYWTQSVGERPSIADGGTHGEYMLYLLGRYGMTGQTREEALTYYNTHNISYLLFSREEIGKYWAFSHIGSNKNLDRESTIGIFGLSETKEVRKGGMFIYSGSWTLDRNLPINGKVFKKGGAAIRSLSLREDGTGGTVTFTDGSSTIEDPLKCIVINSQKTIFDVDSKIGGCFVIVPAFNDNGKGTPIGGALYLSEKSASGLFGRLYIQGEQVKGFEEVYSDDTPLGIYRNQVIGPVKIWKLSYSSEIRTNPLWRSISPEHEEGFR